jgi:murein DD-endopeptidase MepM/ murein hydrolase activator NlpD
VVALALVVATAAPASADDPQAKDRQKKAEQAQVQGQLALAVASDAKVEADVARLGDAVTKTQNQLGDARRALDSAQRSATAATAALNDVTRRLADARLRLTGTAVMAYIHPNLPVPADLDIADLTRRREYLSVAVGSVRDALDGYRQAQAERAEAGRQLQAALAQARTQADTVAGRQSQLVGAQRAQQAVHAELQRRITGLQTESRDLAAQEASIQGLIRSQSAAAQAQLAQLAASSPGAAPGAVPAGTFTPGPTSNIGLIWPLAGPVTSEFGSRWGGFHPGIDIAPGFGTPIHAAKAGVVIFAGNNGGYGNFVLIDHGGGIITGYAHQSRLAVSQGQTVTQGQVIGFEGSTGDSTGPHLHFEVRVNGAVQNPRQFEIGSP